MPAGSPRQRLGDRRVVQQGDSEVGVQLVQATLETLGGVGGVADEALHLQLTELAGVGSREPAAETLDPGDADRVPAGGDDRRVPLEHLDAGGLEALGDSLGLAGVVIVVAEHGDDRHVDDGELVEQTVDLRVVADLRQVAGDAAACRPVSPSPRIDAARRPRVSVPT